MRRAAAIGCSLALVVGLAGCGGGDGSSPSSTTTAAPGTTGGTPSTTSSEAPINDLASVDLKLTEVAALNAPTAMASRAGTSSLFVAEQAGRVRVITVTDDPKTSKRTFKLERTPLLDISSQIISGGEQGLLGLVFSNDGRRLYIAYTARGNPFSDRVDEYTMSGDKVDVRSKRNLIAIDDPFPNHNGGDLHFGPDGYLYIAEGDGGAGGDPRGNAQNTSQLLGKILRIDPEGQDGDLPYGIPDGNPFEEGGGAAEVWSYGLRNPWRFSFDSANGDLWINDVGQGEWEEIDRIPADDGGGRAANFGWDKMEGTHSFEGGRNPEGAVLPVHEYSHDDGACAITGGVVYRGAALPQLVGAYLFADYCLRGIHAIQVDDAGKVVGGRTFDDGTPQITSFGVGPDRAVYVLADKGMWQLTG